MKIDCDLDYATILANKSRPVHLAVRFEACRVSTDVVRRPMAFCIVLDRSGSMAGEPLRKAKAAAEGVVRNLRSEDHFGMVVFDNAARTVVPMQRIANKAETIQSIQAISDSGSTNLTAGWMLGRDELAKTSADTMRRVLLLSDGHLNVGIVQPDEVARIVADGLERGRVRTSSLGFGDNYDEILMERLATCSGGEFYDANSADKLPAIFAAELEGLQKIAAQNVRLRFQKGMFCEGWKLLASYPSVSLPDGRAEIAVGDLVSEEAATVIFELGVMALPLLPDGGPAASLEGEELAVLEILWDDLSGGEVKSFSHQQTIRIQATQNPGDVKLNVDVIPGVANQQTGKALQEARSEIDKGQVGNALKLLRETVDRLKALGTDESVQQGVRSLERMMDELERFGGLSGRTSKSLHYESTHRSKMKSSWFWTQDEEAPDYKRRGSQPPGSVPPANPPQPPPPTAAGDTNPPQNPPDPTNPGTPGSQP